MVLSQALLAENVPRRDLGRAQGVMAAVIVASSTFGPVAGGALTQAFGWPSVFLVNLPFGLLAMLLATRLPARDGDGGRGGFDWPGLALFVGLVVPLLLALEHLQRPEPAQRVLALGELGLSSLCLVMLGRQQRRAAQPLFPLDLLRRPSMWRANAMAACSGALLVSEATLLPLHLGAVDGVSSGRIGLMMLPLTMTVGLGSLVTGRLVSRTGRVALFPAVGQTAAAVGLVFVALGRGPVGGAIGPWGLPAMLAAVAVFQGSAMPVAQITMQSEAPPHMLGAASASVQLSRSVGSAIGVTISLAVLFSTLGWLEAADAFANAVRHGPAAPSHLPEASRTLATAGIENGFSAAFLAIATFALANALLAWTLPLRRL